MTATRDDCPPETGRVLAESLRFHYGPGGFALDIPRLEVARGEHAAIVGPSGCGKTTLLDLLAGIRVPDGGRVVVNGHDLASLSDAARRRFRVGHVGLVFQEFELLDHLTVRENVLLPYFVNRAQRMDATVDAAVTRLLEGMGMARHTHRRPRNLSQGERQRVVIARALVTSPDILMADEPTGNLDPATTRTIVQLILAEARQREMTLVMVTHDHSMLDVFDRVIDLPQLREG